MRLATRTVIAIAIAGSIALGAGASAPTPSPPPSDSSTPDETGRNLRVEDLAKLKQNPVSGLRQVQVNVAVSPDLADSGQSEEVYSLQFFWPFSLGEDWRLVTYTILPVARLPSPPADEPVTGLSDTLINLFVTAKKPGKLVWGVGPAILLPTRTDPALASDRVGLGPAAVLFYEQKKWSAGVLLQNVWSLGGSGTNEVNEFGAQYAVNYNLRHGWYLSSNATITSDWTADSSNRWTVPLGGGFGRVFKLGKQSLSVSLQAFSNVVTPEDGAAWSWDFQFSFLFP